MKDVTMLLNAEQTIRFNQEMMISLVRENCQDFYGATWFLCGELADWTGFIDDYGTFVPVDWC